MSKNKTRNQNMTTAVKQPPVDKLCGLQEASSHLGKSESTILEWAKSGLIEVACWGDNEEPFIKLTVIGRLLAKNETSQAIATEQPHHAETHHEDQPPTHREDPLRSLNEVARQLGKSWATVNSWAHDGLFEVVREPGGRLCVRQSVINRFLLGTNLAKEVQ